MSGGKPPGTHHGVSRGVESPQGADTPGVAKEPRGDKTPGGPTAVEGGPGEDRQGQGGGYKNTPTARATRIQGVNGGNGEPMGGQRTEEPPDTTETAEDDSSAGPRLKQANGANGTSSEHGALAHREYDLLASEATEGGPANAGAFGSEDGHGALANREGTETEEEEDKTPQRTLPARENN